MWTLKNKIKKKLKWTKIQENKLMAEEKGLGGLVRKVKGLGSTNW